MKPAKMIALLALPLAAASVAADKPETWHSGGIGDRIRVADKVVVIPEAVIEDSRCPAEMLCIAAGQVVLKARVQYPDGTVPVTLTLHSPQAVGADMLLLEQVTPERKVAPPAPQDYRFTFAYLPAR